MPKISAIEHQARMELAASRLKREMEIARAKEIISEQFNPDHKNAYVDMFGAFTAGLWKQELLRNYLGGKSRMINTETT